MDFARTVRVDTSIHTIKEVIKKWHGGKIASLTVCKDNYQETNELHDGRLTLKECGIDGATDKSQAPVVTLYYDFKPDGSTDPDPILMWRGFTLEQFCNQCFSISVPQLYETLPRETKLELNTGCEMDA